jgi:hypothetical protein
MLNTELHGGPYEIGHNSFAHCELIWMYQDV